MLLTAARKAPPEMPKPRRDPKISRAGANTRRERGWKGEIQRWVYNLERFAMSRSLSDSSVFRELCPYAEVTTYHSLLIARLELFFAGKVRISNEANYPCRLRRVDYGERRLRANRVNSETMHIQIRRRGRPRAPGMAQV
jgi:hypothetical protein